MQPAEQQTGRAARAQVRGGADEKGKKTTEAKTGGEEERGAKGGGEGRVAELTPVPVAPPLAHQPKPGVSRPPVPHPVSKSSDEMQILSAAVESQNAVLNSAPVLQPHPIAPGPLADVRAKETAPLPPVRRHASNPPNSVETAISTPSTADENLAPARATELAASLPKASTTIALGPSVAAAQPQLSARTGVGGERGSGGEEARMPSCRGRS